MINMLLKIGSRGEQVKRLQMELGVSPTGHFDKLTEAAVRNYQRKHKLLVDGIVGPQTAGELFDFEITSDNAERFLREGNLLIDKYYMDDDEYFSEEKTRKTSIFLHHTAGWNDPYQQVRIWERDKRGRVGTQFLIGGPNSSNGDRQYDGVVIQCFDDEFWAGHLGNVNKFMHKHSVGIELCNFGFLEYKKGEFLTWAGTPVQEDQVIELSDPFRGYRYYHKYSNAQIKSLHNLLLYLSKLHKIDIEEGLQEWIFDKGRYEALEYNSELRWNGKSGLYSHTNVNEEYKWDINPQPNIMNMIEGLVTPSKLDV